MTKIAISPNVNGTGTFTLAAPNSNTDRTLTLPDAGGEVLTDTSDIEAQVKTATSATGTAPIFACRAWVNFKGTGTVAIRASGNVSSITDNGVGAYTVNFTTAMPNANYCVVAGAAKPDSTNDGNAHAQVNGFNNGASNSNTTTSTHIRVARPAGANAIDSGVVTVAIFR